MLQGYIKIALRNVWKHKLFSLINVFGLASGLVVCFLAIAHIKGIYDYDNFHSNRNRIYRIVTNVTMQNIDRQLFATSPLSLAGDLKRNYDFIEETTRLVQVSGDMTGNGKRLENKVYAVDPGFFKLFNYPLEKGRSAIEPGTIVITRKLAQRYFGSTDPIGKALKHSQLGPLTISGVMADLPLNTHLDFDALLSLTIYSSNNGQEPFWNWRQYQNGYTYVLLKPTALAKNLQTALPIVSRRATQELRLTMAKGYTFQAQSLNQIAPARQFIRLALNEPHYGNLLAELVVGLITLLLAGFNYVNLTLARSLGRAREVGVRKVVGALRWQLMSQFVIESVVLSLLALGLAIGMAELIRPMAAVQQWYLGGMAWDMRLWVLFIAFTISVGLLAGFIPARVLSGFHPSQAFRSHQPGLSANMPILRGLSFRKSLIVVQFTISLVALIAVSTLARQFKYMATGDYGFRRVRMLTIPVGNQPPQRLLNQLSQLASVEHVTATSELFGYGGAGSWQQVRRERAGQDSTVASLFAVDPNFVKTMDLTLLVGRNLPVVDSINSTSRSDNEVSARSASRFVLINEQAVRSLKLGDPREAVGKSIWLAGNINANAQVVGVLKDFQFAAFARPIGPMILLNQPNQFRYINVAVIDGADHTVLAEAARIWKRLQPYEPFISQWYDDFLNQLYNKTTDLQLIALLIGMALSIACLGLLGIVTYNTETRRKEVGIRKVMGATVMQVVSLLSWDFVKLLLVSAAIALPLGYLAGSLLLQNFAYRVSIGLETLGLCFGLLLALGSLTIGWRTYRAAQADPAGSLRTE